MPAKETNPTAEPANHKQFTFVNWDINQTGVRTEARSHLMRDRMRQKREMQSRWLSMNRNAPLTWQRRSHQASARNKTISAQQTGEAGGNKPLNLRPLQPQPEEQRRQQQQRHSSSISHSIPTPPNSPSAPTTTTATTTDATMAVSKRWSTPNTGPGRSAEYDHNQHPSTPPTTPDIPVPPDQDDNDNNNNNNDLDLFTLDFHPSGSTTYEEQLDQWLFGSLLPDHLVPETNIW